ncbi:uncharacterized protein FSUBG_10992 [Fusarium subglutinans]|uniref:F-box domain-containing protein n=1 Tax=Gibberella subglutinans TaxID=42677 RepID=A0A8H5LFG7_GIBSU|nr:uncharacterized protein FSUBG_10992 [Fusarium subglutinans]KAF5589886.1 hypothetical protein FSUBG_10992 [Fusarium subglutinans]
MILHTEPRPAASINTAPPELVYRIFDFLLHARDPDEPTAARVDDIRSIRLTCRRFCQWASPLLIPEITVDLTETSLERFRNVSHHQLISSGVRSVHVKLPYYDQRMAADLSHFAYSHMEGMSQYLDHLKNVIPGDLHKRRSYNVPDWVDYDVLELGKNMISAWEPIYNAEEHLQWDSYERLEYRKILTDAHREYQLLFEAQQQMRESGTFLSTVATAMARMPHADRLEITDGEDDIFKRDGYLVDRDYSISLRAVMLRPHTWSDASDLYPDPDFKPPIDLLHRLPVEIYRAGVTLRELKLRCSAPCSYANLSMSPSERLTLVKSLRDLQTLHIEAAKAAMTGWFFDHQEDALELVSDFLSALLEPSRLKDLTINSFNLRSLNELLAGAHNTRLKRLHLVGARLKAGQLGEYLGRVEGPCDVVLEHVEILGGRWAGEADELRGLLRVSTTVVKPFGDEFRRGRSTNVCSAEEERMLNNYLQGASSVNPLRNRNM